MAELVANIQRVSRQLIQKVHSLVRRDETLTSSSLSSLIYLHAALFVRTETSYCIIKANVYSCFLVRIDFHNSWNYFSSLILWHVLRDRREESFEHSSLRSRLKYEITFLFELGFREFIGFLFDSFIAWEMEKIPIFFRFDEEIGTLMV